MRGVLFVVSNLAICVGYVFLAAIVMPRITVKLRRTRYGSIGFFLLCGLHHFDQVLHYFFSPMARIEDVYVETHMLLVDVPQAVCVWMFVTGLYVELVKWGPWGDQTPAS